ncbi:hypothetical protein [Halpernia frigidisoli]|uniref:Uncharacterized protein n=1 Tax=Halpernia frigidisoli TaxID=1125876 RepID=A0A1I3IQ59_9FLAO|nr:hypothetical protein [Halpernia frigidisoli]SFI50108.1 hypothetical protein SAMN05443292_2733 [Halpernia frigidisoli]
MKNIIILIFATTSLISCQNKKPETKIKPENMDISLIKTHLKLQEKIELSEKDTDTTHLYRLTDTDIELGGQIVEQGMKNSGYKSPNKENFEKRVREIFETNCDCKYAGAKKHSNFATYIVNSNQENNILKTEYDYTYNHIFAFPNYKVISNLPLLHDIVEVNNNTFKINLDQNTIARNKYFFNDSRADLTWLLINDKEFLKTLLITFGYDKEEKINALVINELYGQYSTEIPFSNVDKLGEMFFVKDCDGKLIIRELLLKYVSTSTTKDDDRFIYALSSYAADLFSDDVNNIFEEKPSKKFTMEEKAKIVAYVANIESPAFYKFKPMNSDKAWHNAGTTLYNITAAQPEILRIIEKNNYYGLQPLKDVIESDQFAEEAPISN